MKPWQIAILLDGIAILSLQISYRVGWIELNDKKGFVALFFIFLLMFCEIIPILTLVPG